jgi:hypothetical protein
VTEPVDDRATVERLLQAAGLTPSEEETAMFVAMYPMLRAKAARIYELDLGEGGW